MPKLSEVIRRSMKNSGLSLYRIAKDTGVGYTIVHGFYHGDRGLRLSSAEVLAEYLGLELQPKKVSRRRDKK